MPQRADARRNRERALRAGAEVFAELGINAPMSVIAERAGLTKMTLYRHFGSKDELLAAIMAERYQSLSGLARELADAPLDPRAALVSYLEQAVPQVGAERSCLHAALVSGSMTEVFHAAASALDDAVSVLLTRAQASGALRPDITSGDVRAFMLALGSTFPAAAPGDVPGWRRHLELVLDGLSDTSEAIEAPAPRG